MQGVLHKIIFLKMAMQSFLVRETILGESSIAPSEISSTYYILYMYCNNAKKYFLMHFVAK